MGGIRKRHRTHFSSKQVEKLEEIYRQTSNPYRELIVQLSSALNLTDKNISIWFKNRRARTRRQQKAGDGKKGEVTIVQNDITECPTANAGHLQPHSSFDAPYRSRHLIPTSQIDKAYPLTQTSSTSGTSTFKEVSSNDQNETISQTHALYKTSKYETDQIQPLNNSASDTGYFTPASHSFPRVASGYLHHLPLSNRISSIRPSSGSSWTSYNLPAVSLSSSTNTHYQKSASTEDAASFSLPPQAPLPLKTQASIQDKLKPSPSVYKVHPLSLLTPTSTTVALPVSVSENTPCQLPSSAKTCANQHLLPSTYYESSVYNDYQSSSLSAFSTCNYSDVYSTSAFVPPKPNTSYSLTDQSIGNVYASHPSTNKVCLPTVPHVSSSTSHYSMSLFNRYLQPPTYLPSSSGYSKTLSSGNINDSLSSISSSSGCYDALSTSNGSGELCNGSFESSPPALDTYPASGSSPECRQTCPVASYNFPSLQLAL
ncbi:hypothetical protein SNE40_014538 [Patella caerulea]